MTRRSSTCIRDECDEPVRCRYLCKRHYERALNGLEPMPPTMTGYGKPTEERFLARVDKNAPGGCWQWTGGLHDTGYGSFRADGASNAHRWSYQHHVGPIPDGMQIDHLCRNRGCVNPDHLEPVTSAENTRRGGLFDAIRRRAAGLTHCPHGHPKNAANVYRRYDAKRDRWETTCRPCRNARLQRRRETLAGRR